MANRPIKISKLRLILRYYTQGAGSRRISLLLGLARNTVKRYIHRFITLSITHDDVLSLADKELAKLFTSWVPPQHAKRFQGLHKLLPQISQQMTSGGNVTLLQLWEEYYSNDSTGYKYTQFCNHFTTWCKENKVSVINKRWYLPEIPDQELKLLKQWRYSNDRRKWEKAVILLEAHKGTAILKISNQIERSTDKVKDWISAYKKEGLKGLEKRPRKPNEKVVQITQTKKGNLIRLIHETPELHGINRTTWSLKTLSKAYLNKYGSKISITSIGEYIHAEGYRFRKAREVLTSPDPLFRGEAG